MSKRIYLNQDDGAFMRDHPLEDMTVEGIQRVVDYYAQGDQLAGLAFCVNMQRALFDSKAWETLIDDYDPTLGDDQPALHARETRGMLRLRQNGVDQFKVWVDRARHHGVEAFLTMRMNDCHGLEGNGDYWGGHRKKGGEQPYFSRHAAKFWRDHPELRRAPYRYERSFESAFDYARPEVRKRQLSLIAELFERYDMDGLELDWMRWVFMFAPGGEHRGQAILTAFIEEVGALKKNAEKRLGHPILLRHRIPADPWTCLQLGFDVGAWADRGLADHIVLSNFGLAADFDYQIPLWRRLVGKHTKILALVEPRVMARPGVAVTSYHFLYAAAAAALQRGADGVYLFNECYRESSGKNPERALLSDMLNRIGDLDTMDAIVRRYAISYPALRAPGESTGNVLPVPLANDAIGWGSGRWAENITLRLPLGRIDRDATYVLCLGFSADAPQDALKHLAVRINTVPMTAVAEPAFEDCTAEAFPKETHPRHHAQVAWTLCYEAPGEALQDDVNVIEFEPPPFLPGTLQWAEFVVLPKVAISPLQSLHVPEFAFAQA